MARAAAATAAAAAAACLLALVPLAAVAGPSLSLEASARAAVSNDEMQVVLAAERDGTQLAELNDAVLAQLNAAIAEAKATPEVQARLGSVSTQPVFSREGKPIGWRVRGEVVLESRDLRMLSRLAGRLAERMQLASVQFRLSNARRRQEEARLLVDAAASFRQRATDAARAFGFADYEIRELVLDGAPRPVPRAVPMRAAEMQMRAAGAHLPAEGGESDVVVRVTGTVDLK